MRDVVRTLGVRDASAFTRAADKERLPDKEPAQGNKRSGDIAEARRTE